MARRLKPNNEWIDKEGFVNPDIAHHISKQLCKGKPPARLRHGQDGSSEDKQASKTLEHAIPYDRPEDVQVGDDIAVHGVDGKQRPARVWRVLDNGAGVTVQAATSRSGRGAGDILNGLLGDFYSILIYWVPAGRADREIDEQDISERDRQATAALRRDHIKRNAVNVLFSKVDSRYNARHDIPYSLLKSYETHDVKYDDIVGRLGRAAGGDVDDSVPIRMPKELALESLKKLDVSADRFDAYLHNTQNENVLFPQKAWDDAQNQAPHSHAATTKSTMSDAVAPSSNKSTLTGTSRQTHGQMSTTTLMSMALSHQTVDGQVRGSSTALSSAKHKKPYFKNRAAAKALQTAKHPFPPNPQGPATSTRSADQPSCKELAPNLHSPVIKLNPKRQGKRARSTSPSAGEDTKKQRRGESTGDARAASTPNDMHVPAGQKTSADFTNEVDGAMVKAAGGTAKTKHIDNARVDTSAHTEQQTPVKSSSSSALSTTAIHVLPTSTAESATTKTASTSKTNVLPESDNYSAADELHKSGSSKSQEKKAVVN